MTFSSAVLTCCIRDNAVTSSPSFSVSASVPLSDIVSVLSTVPTVPLVLFPQAVVCTNIIPANRAAIKRFFIPITMPFSYHLKLLFFVLYNKVCACAHFRTRADSVAIYSSPRVAHPRGAFLCLHKKGLLYQDFHSHTTVPHTAKTYPLPGLTLYSSTHSIYIEFLCQ